MSQFEVNKGDNIIVGIDVSGSMQATDTPNAKSRIDFSKENTKTIAVEAGKWDTDGVDGFTFGHTITPLGKITADNAAALVDPLRATESSTDTAGAIAHAWKLHRAGGYQQTVLFLITDGIPDDEAKTFATIAGITQELKDPHEFAIALLTVGERSESLQAFLTKLDDGIPGAKEDIVDVKRLEEVDFYKAFAGALHD